MHEPTGDTPTTVTWLVDLDVDATVELPAGEAVARGTFLEWLWATADGLVGVDEGAVDVGEAATLGIVASPLVIDVAAAPADRDWVGSLATARIACAFESEAAAQAATPLLTGLRGCRMVSLRTAAAADETAWRDAFGPIEVAGFGTVRPAWEPRTAGVDSAGTTIFIEPGVGFGTGLHETTRLCLAALAAWRRDGRPCGRVLDFGSGSGILGIAAAVLGARAVDAIEIDAAVHEAIRANAARNGIADRVRVAADLPAAGPGYDLVLANIVAPVLIEHAAVLGSAVRRRPDGGLAGGLFLSGLRDHEVGPVIDRYRVVLDVAPLHATLGDWHCLRFG